MKKRQELAKTFFDIAKYSFTVGLIGAFLTDRLTASVGFVIAAIGVISLVVG